MTTVEPELDQPIYPLSIFEGKLETRDFAAVHMTLRGLFSFIAYGGHDVRLMKNGTAFNLNAYAGDGMRREDNIVETGGIVLNIDNLEPSGVVDLLENIKQYKSICYTTYNHKPNAPRLHLIFPLAAPIQPTDYKKYAQRVADHLNVECDGCSLLVNQIYYMPAHPPEAHGNDHFIQVTADQDFLDVSALPSAPPKRVIGTRGQAPVCRDANRLTH